MSMLDLRENEVVRYEAKGDLWDGLHYMNQRRGRYVITNQRIAFRPSALTKVTQNMVELELTDIESIKKCNVGGLIKIVPTGVKVSSVHGDTYVFSLSKRKQAIALLNTKG